MAIICSTQCIGATDVEITDFTSGLILRSPDNNRWLLSASNDGVLITIEL